MAENLALKSFRLKNFKAVRDSGTVRFTPLTVFIGNNGSGKSSLVEGLQTYQRIIVDGLDVAMQSWRGFEHIRNAAVPRKDKIVSEGRSYQSNPIEFRLSYRVAITNYSRIKREYESQSHLLTVTSSPNSDEVFVFEEKLIIGGKKNLTRNKEGMIFAPEGKRFGIGPPLRGGGSFINYLRHGGGAYYDAYNSIDSWQFVTLNAYVMGDPQPQRRTGGVMRLKGDGSNVAEYLLDIKRRDKDAFEGIIETLLYVLPYARDLQPILTSELERAVHLDMTEEDFKVKGWLLSTGTLRILALLALFRDPDPPPLIIIEEIENGLDPRAIHLIVEEIRNVVESGRSQVVVTTHSPYLLDLLPLSSVVFVERVEGRPTFRRPADEQSLQKWARKFGPGKLYTMGNLSRGQRT